MSKPHIEREVVKLTQQEERVRENAARWEYAVSIGGNQRMNWLDVYDDWNGEGEFTDAIDAARSEERGK